MTPLPLQRSNLMDDFAGQRVVVMGLGRFGGGAGVARFLAAQQAQVLVTDLAPRAQLAAAVASLSGLPIEYRLGEHRSSDFEAADMVVVNPAVDRATNRYVAAARRAGAAISSEIGLLTKNLPNRQRVIGVTGTAGKSTVTAMIGHIIRKGARVWVGGNIGGSLLQEFERIDHGDWVVLELSSFMLEGLAQDRWSPHVAVVTNIAPNHLNRHGSFTEYVKAKQAILAHQGPNDVAFLGTGVADWPTKGEKVVVGPAAKDVPLGIAGCHNQMNAQMALAVSQHVLMKSLDRPLADFQGLPHRLQLVAQHGTVRFYNDSKATTPEAAIHALRSFAKGTVHAIVGGSDKGADLAELAEVAASHCRAIYTVGSTGESIAHACQQAGAFKIVRSQTLCRAVAAARRNARSGDVVLLSPGCASLDQFENFEARGDAFITFINAVLSA